MALRERERDPQTFLPTPVLLPHGETSSGGMDMEELKILSDDGFLDYHHRDEKGFISRDSEIDPTAVIDMIYFICASPSPPRHLRKFKRISGSQIIRNKPVTSFPLVTVCLEPMVRGDEPI